jgi:hypothetical protein
VELQYDVAYHLHCQLVLPSGRSITLESLNQRMTYAELIAGVPDARVNDWEIKCALQEAQRFCIDGAAPHLLSPPRRSYLRKPGDMDPIVKQRPYRTPEWLPMVRCIGSFKSFPPSRDASKHGSFLVVVWFQDEYAPPIREPAIGQLLAIDWEALAADFDY